MALRRRQKGSLTRSIINVVIGQPGVGKSVLREHIENLVKERDVVVVSCSRTLHTYLNILKQLAESFKIDVPSVSSKKN